MKPAPPVTRTFTRLLPGESPAENCAAAKRLEGAHQRPRPRRLVRPKFRCTFQKQFDLAEAFIDSGIRSLPGAVAHRSNRRCALNTRSNRVDELDHPTL